MLTFHMSQVTYRLKHVTCHMSHITHQMLHTHMSDNSEHGLWERCWCWTGLEPAKESKSYENNGEEILHQVHTLRPSGNSGQMLVVRFVMMSIFSSSQSYQCLIGCGFNQSYLNDSG